MDRTLTVAGALTNTGDLFVDSGDQQVRQDDQRRDGGNPVVANARSEHLSANVKVILSPSTHPARPQQRVEENHSIASPSRSPILPAFAE